MADELRLTHVDTSGEAHMVDVGSKKPTCRIARVGARVWMARATMELLRKQALPKGDVLAVAKIAGIMAAKRTSELVPLCHPLSLTHVDVSFSIADDEPRIDIECVSRTEDRTGVEMEALTGATVAAITIYDMCKAVDRGMIIGDIRLLEKTGGKEDYMRDETPPAAASPQANRSAVPAAAASGGDAAGAVAPSPLGPDPVPPAPSPLPSGFVLAVNISAAKGERKKPVPEVVLQKGHGIVGDAHAGEWHRQVSLLAQESIDKMVAKGLQVAAGDFAENVTSNGIDVAALPIGTTIDLGEALVQVTQIGKECHTRCAIYHQAGDCVMPREGIFVRVLRGGRVAPGDRIEVLSWGCGN